MSLYVETLGQGPGLVLLHGWGMHGGVWEPVVDALAESHCLYIVDLPGLGFSPTITPYTLESLVKAVSQTVPARTAVCGWSLGGQVALKWALDNPGQVERLILVGTTPRFVSGDDWPFGIEAEVLQQFADQVRDDYRGALSRFLSLQAHGGDTPKKTIRRLRESFFRREVPAAGVLQSGLELLLDTDLRPELSKLAVPALVLHGDYDMLVPVAAGRWLAQQLPSARAEIREGASHAPFLSHPAWFVEKMRSFLGG
jgi:pimeloyl-[acyl-carrier protein] methyl ester esterase